MENETLEKKRLSRYEKKEEKLVAIAKLHGITDFNKEQKSTITRATKQLSRSSCINLPAELYFYYAFPIEFAKAVSKKFGSKAEWKVRREVLERIKERQSTTGADFKPKWIRGDDGKFTKVLRRVIRKEKQVAQKLAAA